jgi:hypothetical protein
MLNLIGEEAQELIKSADRLAQYVLEQVTTTPCKDPHKKAIMLAVMTGTLLQATYTGKEPIISILVETARLMDTFSQFAGEA